MQKHDGRSLNLDTGAVSSGEEPMLKRVLDAMDTLKRKAAGR